MSAATAGILWAITAGLAFGLGQIANRGVNRRMPAIAASTAMLTAVLVALVIASAAIGDLGRISAISAGASWWYAVATVVHFGIGWTLFVVSQQRIGPSRTASVLSTNPVMAALVAAVVLSEQLRAVTWIGVVLVTLGVARVATGPGETGPGELGRVGRGRAALWPVLAATFMFSVSPLPVREGLALFPEARLGLIVGLIVTVPLMHAATRVMSGGWVRWDPMAVKWLVLGGTAAGLAIAAQWTALDLIPVGAAISLQQLNTPTVLFLGPILLRAPRERPSARMLVGTALILVGAILVALFGRSAG